MSLVVIDVQSLCDDDCMVSRAKSLLARKVRERLELCSRAAPSPGNPLVCEAVERRRKALEDELKAQEAALLRVTATVDDANNITANALGR